MAQTLLRYLLPLLAALVPVVAALPAMAEGGGLLTGAAPLLSNRINVAPSDRAPGGASLFANGGPVRAASLLAPRIGAGTSRRAARPLGSPAPPRDRLPPERSTRSGPVSEPVARLLSLIARAEAGSRQYDAVQHGARIPPPRPPTDMTLADIARWTSATPGQPHAIGRYQFIPPTLRRVAAHLGLGPETRFSPAVQDALALVLLEEAGLRGFEAGRIDRRQFLHGLARIWAGLPLPDGRSYYEGHAGNSAAMSWAEFDSGIARIWPRG